MKGVEDNPTERDAIYEELRRVAAWYMLRRRSASVAVHERREGGLEDFLQEVAVWFLKSRGEQKLGNLRITTLATKGAIWTNSLYFQRLQADMRIVDRKTRTAGNLRDKLGREYRPAPEDPLHFETEEEVEVLLDGMPDRDRKILMRRLAGETLQSIATEQGVTRERARQIETRAYAFIKEKLAESVPAGVYISPNFPDGTSAIVEDDGSVIHICGDGREIPMEIPVAWIAEFIACGEWNPKGKRGCKLGNRSWTDDDRHAYATRMSRIRRNRPASGTVTSETET